MKQVLTLSVLLALLSGCGASDEPERQGVSRAEAEALNKAAEQLDEQKPPPPPGN